MAELYVSKKTVGKLFSEMQNRKFVIPDYQRPYKWNIEKCETLWSDIENFAQTDATSGADYFLGTIVSYTNDDKNQEIIDGQQRITSFMLLLRAFYRKLEDMTEDARVMGLKNQLAPCIWDVDKVSQVVTDKTKIHIVSEVATEEDNETFHRILETGDVSETLEDNYSKNYRFFKKRCDEYAMVNPMQWQELCVTILSQCIILPIECDAQDTALTIFSTLNDRGMPLADSDIFKAQIYRNCPTQDKRKEFTETWKELTQICKRGHLSIDDIFRYYSHALRARVGDKSKEVGLRKFYAENKYERLKNADLMSEIMTLAFFWRFVNAEIEPENEYQYSISTKARIHLHCLSCYPNEFWKYATSVFFLKHKDSETFEQDFEQMLQKLIAFLFAKFIEQPSVNAIKDDIYNACISLNVSKEHPYKFNLNEELLSQQIDGHSSSRISRALLLLYAYLNPNQTQLIPGTFDIEHIFPKKWQEANYNGWSNSDAALYLDRFGNKTVFEKKLNIQAGNGYFGVKKQKYKVSGIATVLELSNYSKSDWVKMDIEEREKNFKIALLNYFKTNLAVNN
ncbi:Uncharacterized conserved protein, contains ParB-like and HNH nuclease domains [Filimonas lacunae]|uniref:Uncharacterized conserved protein, contains ParB-like and HNH nuclease domains n=1 Tax=Filimonas lacunae TaxID=477680 RepID=A0A173MJX1_9BACT|nr:DUF262 domain-containing protein [Filimonas lacunae]BAV07698.1 hypothetical protein FLA_3729 [Filimonas lacunae]SIT03673.1 Uncharacterized conserved protein, contains ParB-like and HNH nuclease domains [Filimonas lacunae]